MYVLVCIYAYEYINSMYRLIYTNTWPSDTLMSSLANRPMWLTHRRSDLHGREVSSSPATLRSKLTAHGDTNHDGQWWSHDGHIGHGYIGSLTMMLPRTNITQFFEFWISLGRFFSLLQVRGLRGQTGCWEAGPPCCIQPGLLLSATRQDHGLEPTNYEAANNIKQLVH